MNQNFWYIRNCSLFERATEADLEQLELDAKKRTFAKGDAIYMPRDNADGAFLLASGRVQIGTSTPDGKQAIIAMIEPGELFGELSLLSGGPREERAEAVTDSIVIALPRPNLLAMMERSSHMCIGITKIIGLRRQRIERRLRSLLFHSNREKLVHLLVELADQYGKETEHGLLINIRLTHQDLANIIGVTRESVTILLGELQNEGVLKLSRQRIEIIDFSKLYTESGRPPLLRQIFRSVHNGGPAESRPAPPMSSFATMRTSY